MGEKRDYANQKHKTKLEIVLFQDRKKKRLKIE